MHVCVNKKWKLITDFNSQFAVSLSLVLIMELGAAIAAYALQDGIKDLLAERINSTMHEYDSNLEAKTSLDFLQSRVIYF